MFFYPNKDPCVKYNALYTSFRQTFRSVNLLRWHTRNVLNDMRVNEQSYITHSPHDNFKEKDVRVFFRLQSNLTEIVEQPEHRIKVVYKTAGTSCWSEPKTLRRKIKYTLKYYTEWSENVRWTLFSTRGGWCTQRIRPSSAVHDRQNKNNEINSPAIDRETRTDRLADNRRRSDPCAVNVFSRSCFR